MSNRARGLGIRSVPAVVVDGKLADCCAGRGPEAEADARFQLAIALLGQGKREEAIAEMKRAFRLDLENWLIRKQLWAVEHPEAFYSWQKRWRQQEEAEIKQK